MLHAFASPLAFGAGLCRAAAIEWRATRRLSVTTGRPVRWVSAINTVSQAIMAGHPAKHAQQDATQRTMALGMLILNAFLVRAAPSRFIGCRCSAIQNNAQTNTCDPRRPGATSSLLSCRQSCRQSWTFGRRSSFRRSWAKTRLSNNEPTKKAISKSVSRGRNRYVRYCGYRTRERTWPYRRE